MRPLFFALMLVCFLAGSAALALYFSGTAIAQSSGLDLPPTTITSEQSEPSAQATPSKVREGRALVLDEYLHHHPKLSQKLHRSPDLLKDPAFIRGHRELEQFIARHPGSREQFEVQAAKSRT